MDLCIYVLAMYQITEGRLLWLRKVGAVLCSMLLLGSVVGAFLFLSSKFKQGQLTSIEVDTKYGTLWYGMDTSRFKAVQYTTVFFLRRIAFALFSVYLGHLSGGLIIIAVLYICMANQMFYLLPVHPNLEKKDQAIEVISEVLLMYFFYGVMIAEAWEDPEYKFRIGWFSVSAVALIVAINLINAIRDAVMHYYRYLKRQYDIKIRKQAPEPSKEIAARRSFKDMRKRNPLRQSVRELNQSERKSLFPIEERDENSEVESETIRIPKTVDEQIRLGLGRLKEVENLNDVSEIPSFHETPTPSQQP